MQKLQYIHFIGIGGIGVSALAKYYLSKGAQVSGSDLARSEITDELERFGVKIVFGEHHKENIPPEARLVIYTAAVRKNNPERLEASRLKIKQKTYAEAIGELTKKYKTITISGSHGKSTTTALSALVLEEGHFDPTVIVGTKIREYKDSNFKPGRGQYLVLEADEWNRSFLKYHPFVAVVTNIDAEHLDTYKNRAGVEKAFASYLKKVPAGGRIIANADDKSLKKVAKKFGKKVRWYSVNNPEAKFVRRVLRIPGEHNLSNALAAFTLGRELGIRDTDILHALSRFTGTWRRFELKGTLKGAYVFADYGHHPREISATLQAARDRFPFRRIWCVYQPHQYRRLANLWKDFIPAFDMADRILLLPVYDVAGRETAEARISVNSLKLSQELVRRGKQAAHFDTFLDAENYIRQETRRGDVVLVMGAGDIYPAFTDAICT